MSHYDITLKNLFNELPQQLFQLLWGAAPVELLNLEFSKTQQRRPDIVAKLSNGQLYHLELQSDNDDKMEWRELEYYSLIYRNYGQAPIQQVLYVGHKRPRFTTQIQHERLQFSYQLIDIRSLDGSLLLNSSELSDNVISLLGHLPDRRAAVKQVLQRIVNLPENRRNDMTTRLAVLAGLRPLELPQLLEQESRHMSIRVNLLENPLFKEQYERDMRTAMLEGEEKGKQEGKQEGQLETMRLLLQRMQQQGVDLDFMQKISGLSKTEIERLLQADLDASKDDDQATH